MGKLTLYWSSSKDLQSNMMCRYTNVCANYIVMSLFVTSAEEGGYVFGAVCLSVCLSVGLLANL